MKTKRITALLLAAVLAFGLAGCSKGGGGLSVGGDTSAQTQPGDTSAVSPDSLAEPEEPDTSAPAVWTEMTAVSENTYTYFFNSYYREFATEYFKSGSKDGLQPLDPEKPLVDQLYSEDLTWHQYLTIKVYDQLTELLAMADGAKAQGLTLSDEDNKYLDSQLAVFATYAATDNCTVSEYLEACFGKGVGLNSVRKAYELRLLANKYYNYLWEGYDFTEEECAAYYEENKGCFVRFDCIRLTVLAENAELFSAVSDEESFVNVMRDVITRESFDNDYDRFKDAVESQIKERYHKDMLSGNDATLAKWIADPERQSYDVYIGEEKDGKVTVLMALPTSKESAVNEVAYKDEGITKNFRYMVFKDSEGVEGITKADTIYKNWQENPTEERFEELCGKYSGGLATDIAVGIDDESVDGWIFDESRVPGECAVIKGEQAAYLIYMLEDGDPAWLVSVRTKMEDEAYNKAVADALSAHPAEFSKDFVYNIVEITL